MAITSAQLQNAIRLANCNHDPLCCGYRWVIQDQLALAQLVAWTMQGHYRHAERLLTELASGIAPNFQTIKQQAINNITLPANTGNEAARWHRDGLVFQQIAWIAAQLEARGKVATSMPHIRPAHKGFDSLLVPLNDKREALAGIVICEDKATTNPRRQITSKVWPEVASVEAGERDAELNAELTLILERGGVANIDEILCNALWLNRKFYRVSITITPNYDTEPARRDLFEGYDAHAPGLLDRRRAETLVLKDLRIWMDTFCAQVIAAIQAE